MNNNLLEELGFFHPDGSPELWRHKKLETGIIETYPEFTDNEGQRVWKFIPNNSVFRINIFPTPKKLEDILYLMHQLTRGR